MKHGAKVAAPGDGYEMDGFNLDDQAYVEINGFEITAGRMSAGVASERAHHVRIKGNHVHHCGGSGIQPNGGDCIHVEDNIVHHSSF